MEPIRAPSRPTIKLAFCIPVFDDWQCAAEILRRLDAVAAAEGWSAQVLFVDDGSSTPGWRAWSLAPCSLERIRVLMLRRNLGHQRAIACGLSLLAQEREVDAVVVMDGDGEDPPERVPQLVERFVHCERRRIVFARRAKRSESMLFRWFYQLYRILHFVLTGRKIRVGNFSIAPMDLVERLVFVSELWNHYAASVYKARLPTELVPIPRAARIDGGSRMGFVSLVVHGLSAISVYLEDVGARILSACLALALFVCGAAGVVIFVRLGTNLAIPGWATYAIGLLVILLFSAIQLAVVMTLLILYMRNSQTVIPLRDSLLFHDRLEQVYPAHP